ncbi:MAG: gliding motility-associated C-terminal domain-containing protein [Bacteroidota bacterium]
MTNNYPLLLTIVLLSPFISFAQTDLSGIINSYTAVTDQDQCEAIITVANASTFSPGDAVLLIQMQGATMNETNTSSFGSLVDLGGAGWYERNEISTINGNQIQLRYSLLHAYDLSGSVQLITIPTYEEAIVSTTLTGANWDGTTGGVVVFDAGRELTVSGAIDATGIGFRGGQANTVVTDTCSSVAFGDFATEYFFRLGHWEGAQKGEGITAYINDKESGQGKQLNGGGGANDHNTGGGGGGHHTPGGQGGLLEGIDGCRGEFSGLGGRLLPNDSMRLFMGGGGGGGHAADGNGSDGGAGGGIVIVFADRILGGGSIRVNGETAADAQEGAGGGGAAGSIVLMIEEFRGLVLLESNGGNGGNTDAAGTPNCAGPGGGGSAGRIYTSDANTSNPGLAGGSAGIVTNSSAACDGTTNGASNSFRGQVRLLTQFPQNFVESPVIDTVQIANCGNTTGSSITFDIDYPADMFEYSILRNGQASPATTTSDDSIRFDNLPAESTLTLLVRAVGSNGCSSAPDTIECTTFSCGGIVFAAETNIDTLYCLDDADVTLSANPGGGTFALNNAPITQFSPSENGVGRTEIQYTYTDSLGCIRDDFFPIRVATTPEVPMPTCSAITDSSVVFSWDAITDASQYRIFPSLNGAALVPNVIDETTLAFNNLNPGDAIRIEMVALGVGPCGESDTISQICIAQNCPEEIVQIDSLIDATFCTDDAIVQLTANPAGGQYVGEGVTMDGSFDPSLVQIPEDSAQISVPIIYTLPDAGSCPGSADTIVLTVLPLPVAPVVNCDSTASDLVRFAWLHPADSFDISYSINGSPPIMVAEVMDSLFTIDDLMRGDSVEFIVSVMSECGMVSSTPAVCLTTDDCDDTTTEILGLAAAYCREDDDVQLTAVPSGGVFAGDAVSTTGLFSPSTANLGSNLVTYEFVDPAGCVFRDTVATEISNETPVPEVTCIPGANLVTFTWTHPTIDSFEYQYFVGAENPVGPIFTTDTSLMITGLMSGDEVFFSVTALSSTGCGNSVASDPIPPCVVEDCSNDDPPVIQNLAENYCVDQDAVILEAEPSGGTFLIEGDVVTTIDPASLGIGTFQLEYVFIDIGGCELRTDAIIEIVETLAPPTINCSDSTAQSLEFTWDNAGGLEFGYNIIVGSDTIRTDTTSLGMVSIGGLSPADSALIELIPVGSNLCVQGTTTQVCYTIECNETLEATSDLAGEYCLSDRNIELNAMPSGGIFSGDGVDPEGFFNPALAGSGELRIAYDFVDELGCPGTDTFTTNIVLAVTPPTVSCGDVNASSATFNWSHPNAEAVFGYSVSLDGVDFSPEVISADTIYTQNNVAANSEVILRIYTIGPEECGNSDTIIISCSTNNCVPFDLNVLPVGDVCVGEDAEIIDLETNLPDSIVLLDGRWIGDGIIDEEEGFFDPTDPNVNMGPNLVRFEGTDANGCPYETSTSINLRLQPIIEILEAPEINCQDSLIVLGTNMSNTDEETNYRWETIEGNIISGENESNAVVNRAGTYIITASNGSCMTMDSLVILENRVLPVADAGANQSVACDATMMVKLGGAGTSDGDQYIYSWAGPANFTSNDMMIEVTEVGTYTLIVEDTTNFCRSEPSMVEVIDSSSTVTALINVGGLLTCENETVTLDGANSAGEGDLQYEWSNAQGIVSDFSAQSTFAVTEPGNYSLRVRDAGGCVASTSVVIGEDRDLPNVDAGPNQNIGCVIEEVTLGSDSNDTGSNFQFRWTGGNLGTDAPLRPMVTTDGIYILTIRNTQNGCVASDTAFVTANDALITGLNSTIETPLCFGDDNGSIIINEVLGGTAPYLYAFNGGRFSSLNRFSNLTPANYTIEVRDAAGCSFEANVVVEAPLEVQATLSAETEITLGDSVVVDLLLNPAPDSLNRISWNVNDSIACEGCVEFGIRPSDKTTILVEVEDMNGCVVRDILTLFVVNDDRIFMPNAFSPNGDSRNDRFFLQVGENVDRIDDLKIYDRWGMLVFQQNEVPLNDPTAGWDGTFRGKLLNPAVFVYSAIITYKDGRTETILGDVTLIR